MLVDAIEFSVADLIVSAINTAALDSANFGAFQVTAELDPAGMTDLSKAGTSVKVFVIPSRSNTTLATLDGDDQNSIEVILCVAKKLEEGTAEEVKQLTALARSVWRVIQENVDANCLIFISRDGDDLYDYDAIRIKREFYSEAVFTWTYYPG